MIGIKYPFLVYHFLSSSAPDENFENSAGRESNKEGSQHWKRGVSRHGKEGSRRKGLKTSSAPVPEPTWSICMRIFFAPYLF